jgi:hypothetical protein
MAAVQFVTKRLMQIAWLVTLLAIPLGMYLGRDNDLQAAMPAIVIAGSFGLAAICLSVLYVLVAISASYIKNEPLPYVAISVFTAAVAIVILLVIIGSLGRI